MQVCDYTCRMGALGYFTYLCMKYTQDNCFVRSDWTLESCTLGTSLNWYFAFIQAYFRGIYRPRYLLLTVAWYSRFWWRVEGEGLPCTANQRERVLLSTLGFTGTVFLDPADVNITTSMGIVRFMAKFMSSIGDHPVSVVQTEGT